MLINFKHLITIFMAGSGRNKVLTAGPKTFEQCVCWLKGCYDL